MLTNKELGEYLHKIRDDRNLSLRQVNYHSGVSYSHLSMIESGTRKAQPLTLKELSKVYKIDYIDLLEKAGYIDLAEKEKIDNNIQGLNKKIEKSAIVLVYGSIPAGVPMECIEDIIDTEEISADMLKGGKQYFGLKVKGDSMSPEYLDKDILICEKVDDCNSGDDCIVMVNGYDGTFKRVIKNEDAQTIKLQPLNTTLDENGNFRYEPKIYSKEEIENLPVKIIGKVVELRRKKK